jgi:hypothetical protein
MAWTWGSALSTAPAATTAPGAAASAVPAAAPADAKCVECEAPAREAKTGVPVSDAPHGAGKPGTGVDAV